MSNKMFMRVEDVAEEMGVSVSYAYKLIRKLNKELQSTGCITIPGRIDRKFFHAYGISYQNKRCHDGRKVNLNYEQRDDVCRLCRCFRRWQNYRHDRHSESFYRVQVSFSKSLSVSPVGPVGASAAHSRQRSADYNNKCNSKKIDFISTKV